MSRKICHVCPSGGIVCHNKDPQKPSSSPEIRLRWGDNNKEVEVTEDSMTLSPGARFRLAMMLAVAADALQIAVFPLFVEGAFSPSDDVLDVAMAAILIHLLGWQWEFLPSFLAKVVPGVDVVPFWSLAVANVYRKWKRSMPTADAGEEAHALLKP